jgi:hypothetical protein
MIKSSEPPRIVFLHIPKTGGTTLHRVLIEQFKPEQIWPQTNPTIATADPMSLGRYRLFSAHFGMAAVDLIPDPKIVVTIMRRPRDRILSMYYYWRSHPGRYPDTPTFGPPYAAQNLDLLSFLQCQGRSVPNAIQNPVVNLLTGIGPQNQTRASLSRAIEVLKTFNAIGDFASFDSSVSRILARCNFPQPSIVPRLNAAADVKPGDPFRLVIEREPITPEIEAELARVSNLDDELYEFVVSNSQRAG